MKNPIGKAYCEKPGCFEERDHARECRGLHGEPLPEGPEGLAGLAEREARPSPFKARTGLMGATAPGQQVTAENMHHLPPGSTVRTTDHEWLVHLHDGVWLRIFNCGHCYDRAERFHPLLPGTLCHHP